MNYKYMYIYNMLHVAQHKRKIIIYYTGTLPVDIAYVGGRSQTIQFSGNIHDPVSDKKQQEASSIFTSQILLFLQAFSLGFC